MMSPAYIDVYRTYFSVDAVRSVLCGLFFDDEDDFSVTMNYVIPKPYAINCVYSLFEKYMSEFSELYVSVDAVKVKQITDYLGDKIFDGLDDNISGWLFFLDPIPFANWDHPCRYLFVVDVNSYEEIEYCRGLDERIQMEKIN